MLNLVEQKQHRRAKIHRFKLAALLFYGIDKHTSQFPVYEYIEVFDDGDYVYFEEDIFAGRDNETEQQQQHYLAQQIKASYRYKPQKKLSLFNKKSQLYLSFAGTFYQRQVSDEKNYQQGKLESSLSLLTSKKLLWSAIYRGRFHYQDKRHFLDDNSIMLSLSMPLTYGRIKLGIEHRQKDYPSTGDFNNANSNIPMIEYSYSPTAKYKLQLGSQYRIYQANDEFNSYRTANIYVNFHYLHSDKLQLLLSFNSNNLGYTIDDPELVNWSSEQKNSIATRLTYRFNTNLTIGLNAHHIRNTLNNSAGQDKWQRFETFIRYRF